MITRPIYRYLFRRFVWNSGIYQREIDIFFNNAAWFAVTFSEKSTYRLTLMLFMLKFTATSTNTRIQERNMTLLYQPWFSVSEFTPKTL